MGTGVNTFAQHCTNTDEGGGANLTLCEGHGFRVLQKRGSQKGELFNKIHDMNMELQPSNLA